MLNTILEPIAMRKLSDGADVYFTSGKNVNVDTEYNLWLNELKNRFYQAQIRATVKVNAEKLHQAGGELQKDLSADGLNFPEIFALVPWSALSFLR